MNALNYNSLCEEAELHYYDFICDETRPSVPDLIIEHIEQCQHCRQQIKQLKKILSETENQGELGQTRLAVTKFLELHFVYIGKYVTCRAVRPFLPGLSDPAVEIKIPTPITVHLDNCQQCRNDQETIRKLDLNQKQLWRLGQLLADSTEENAAGCQQGRQAAASVAAMDWSGLDAEVLKHLCTCPVCRDLLREQRQDICDSLPEYDQSPEFPCESVLAPEIFDYCFPYGIDPAADEYARFRTALVSHLRSCRQCLAKMQQLHRTISEIAEQLESDVVTIYTIDKSAKTEVPGESDNPYAGFPVRVEVADIKSKADDEPPATNYRRMLKPAIAAAAVILIAVGLLINAPTAGAATIEQIYKAIEKIKNVYIAKFGPESKELTQELWLSKELNFYMTKTGSEMVLWDIDNTLRKTKQPDTGTIETIQLTEERFAGIRKRLSSHLGLMPFENMSDIPADRGWDEVTDKYPQAAAEGLEVYELTWIRKRFDGSDKFWKWRFYINPETYLPERTECYHKLPADEQYSLLSVNVVEYLDKSEIQAALKSGGF